MTGRGITDEDLAELVARVREATGALIRGDVRRYLALVPSAEDYTLMPPTGGETRHGFDSSAESIEALEGFFAGEGEASSSSSSRTSRVIWRCWSAWSASTASWAVCPTRTGRCG